MRHLVTSAVAYTSLCYIYIYLYICTEHAYNACTYDNKKKKKLSLPSYRYDLYDPDKNIVLLPDCLSGVRTESRTESGY